MIEKVFIENFNPLLPVSKQLCNRENNLFEALIENISINEKDILEFINVRQEVLQRGKIPNTDRSLEEAPPIAVDSAIKPNLIPVNFGIKWGFVDSIGNEIIPPIYEEIGSFSDGRMVVKRDSLWGFIDSTGREVIKTQYDVAYEFNEGKAIVLKGNKLFSIDLEGNETFVSTAADTPPGINDIGWPANWMLKKRRNADYIKSIGSYHLL